jgi:hypothetical protein
MNPPLVFVLCRVCLFVAKFRGICAGAFPDAIEDRKVADSKKSRKGRRNSLGL